MTLQKRVSLVVKAFFLAWLAGVGTTLPLQFLVAFRNSDGDSILMGQLFALGMMVWAVWTLMFSFVGWMLVALPIAVLVSPQHLQRYRWILIVAFGLAAFSVPAIKFTIWKVFRSDERIDKLNFRLYATFLTTYAALLPAIYIRLLRRQPAP